MRTALMLTTNEHSMMFRTTNGDLYDILRSFVAFSLTRAKKMAANINDTERNTLPKFQYSYIASKLYIIHTYIYIYIYIAI